jgi:hypothetical protein
VVPLGLNSLTELLHRKEAASIKLANCNRTFSPHEGENVPWYAFNLRNVSEVQDQGYCVGLYDWSCELLDCGKIIIR